MITQSITSVRVGKDGEDGDGDEDEDAFPSAVVLEDNCLMLADSASLDDGKEEGEGGGRRREKSGNLLWSLYPICMPQSNITFFPAILTTMQLLPTSESN